MTPVQPFTIMGGQALTQLIMAAAGTIILVVIGRLLFEIEFPLAPVAIVGAVLAGGAAMVAMGFAIAAVTPNARVAGLATQAIFYPMIFLSGATFPRDVMPEAIQRVGDYLPLTHVVTLAQDQWFDQSWNLVSLGVIAATLVIGLVIGARTFRWDPA